MQTPEENFGCIDASALVSVDKLFQALTEVRLNADVSFHREELFKKLQTTTCSMVMFSDFVKCVKEVYRLESVSCNPVSSIDDRSRSLAILMEDNSTHEINLLRTENESLKHQLEMMQKLCLKCEDDETRLRKEFQFQMETVNNLRKCLQEAKDKNNEEPKKSPVKDSGVSGNPAIEELRSEDCRNVARQMLHFIETLPSTLSKLEPPNRISSCTGVAPRSVVTRAATVNSRPSRTADVTMAGPYPPKYVRGERRSHSDRSAILTKLIQDAEKIVATAKPILAATEGSYVNSVGSIQSQNVAEAIGRLHRNIPSTAVVTIMTRV